MAIPLSYNVRNLRLRKSLTVMTALGIALTVATAVFIMALLAGLGRAFASTGDPLNVLMLRKGSDSELAAGGVSRDAMQVLKDLPGVAKNSQGEPLVSGEDILVVVMPRKGGTGETNVTTRFLTPCGIEKCRPQICAPLDFRALVHSPGGGEESWSAVRSTGDLSTRTLVQFRSHRQGRLAYRGYL